MYPMTESTPQESAPAAAPLGKPIAKRKLPLVLVVDDFEDNRSMYAVYLTYSGYDVIEAGDGAEAVELAGERLPDLVVMDLSLPIMDGWEATRRLKSDPRTCHIPIIALTGHALEGHSRDARKAGCNAFLAKPCLPETLVAKVQELMQTAAMTQSGKGGDSDSR
jgi:two-component system cell cycle response regulator DivK